MMSVQASASSHLSQSLAPATSIASTVDAIEAAAEDSGLAIPPLTGLAIARHFMRPPCGIDGYTYK